MEFKVITSGFYQNAEDAANEINEVFTKLGKGWKLTDLKVNTVENICDRFYTTSPSTSERRKSFYSSPFICYSAVAIKENAVEIVDDVLKKSGNDIFKKSDSEKDEISGYPWDALGITEDEYMYRKNVEHSL